MANQRLLAWSQLQEAEIVPEVFTVVQVKSRVNVAFGFLTV